MESTICSSIRTPASANLLCSRALRAVARNRPSVWERTLLLCVMVTTALLEAGGDLAGHVGDAVAGALGDALDGLCDLAVGAVVGLFFLDVQVLGVLAHDDEVDWVWEGGGRGDGLDGADVGVEV
jgi:hypothetical protein